MRAGPGGGAEPHYGLDIAAPLGSPIRNWWGGVVSDVLAGGACGNGLVIRSGPYEHLYCHLAGEVRAGVYRSGEVLVARGQRLQAGQMIGHVGITGRTTGPHLHWGIRYRRQWLDPAAILRAMARARQGGEARAAVALGSGARPRGWAAAMGRDASAGRSSPHRGGQPLGLVIAVVGAGCRRDPDLRICGG